MAIVGMVLSLSLLVGCGQKPAANATEAIEYAKQLDTAKQQSDYLVSQALALLNSKDYQEAAKTAQYVLSSVDTQSQPAKQVLEESKSRLASDAKAALGDSKEKIGL